MAQAQTTQPGLVSIRTARQMGLLRGDEHRIRAHVRQTGMLTERTRAIIVGGRIWCPVYRLRQEQGLEAEDDAETR